MKISNKRDYGLWLGATTADMFGRSAQDLALPFIIISFTGSAAISGNIQTAGKIATLAVILFGGVLIDRIDRRIGMYLRSFSGAILWALLGTLILIGIIPVWAILAIVLLTSITDGLFGEADNAALRSIIQSNEEFIAVRSINQGRAAAIQLTGGPIGAFLYHLGHAIPFFFSSLCLAILGICAKLIRADLRPKSDLQESAQQIAGSQKNKDHTAEKESIIRNFFADLKTGFKFIFTHSRIRPLLIANIFIGSGMMMIIFTADYALITRGHTPLEISLLSTLFALIMMGGAALSAKFSARIPAGKGLIILLLGMALIAAATIFWNQYFQLLLILSLYGAIVPFIGALLGGYCFSATPSDFQARVGSASNIMEFGLTAFVPFIAGNLVNHGLAAYGFALGAIINLIALLILASSKAIRSLGNSSTWTPVNSTETAADSPNNPNNPNNPSSK
ncbi:MFS transporter [Arcanobacterium hippocoleae]